MIRTRILSSLLLFVLSVLPKAYGQATRPDSSDNPKLDVGPVISRMGELLFEDVTASPVFESLRDVLAILHRHLRDDAHPRGPVDNAVLHILDGCMSQNIRLVQDQIT